MIYQSTPIMCKGQFKSLAKMCPTALFIILNNIIYEWGNAHTCSTNQHIVLIFNLIRSITLVLSLTRGNMLEYIVGVPSRESRCRSGVPQECIVLLSCRCTQQRKQMQEWCTTGVASGAGYVADSSHFSPSREKSTSTQVKLKRYNYRLTGVLYK